MRDALVPVFARRGCPAEIERLHRVLRDPPPSLACETVEEAIGGYITAHPRASKNEVYRAVSRRGLLGAGKQNVLNVIDAFRAAEAAGGRSNTGPGVTRSENRPRTASGRIG
jgi:hypothetical protein